MNKCAMYCDFMMFCEFYSGRKKETQKTPISPTKLFNLGIIKPTSHLEFFPRGLYIQPKGILGTPCSEEFDPASNFSPFLLPPEILFIKHLLPTSREIEKRSLWVLVKMRSCPKVFIAQKINT